MSDELRLAATLLISAGVAWIATPGAIRLACRLNFHDQPNADYKRHRPATPYLGGLAIALGFLAAAVPFGGGTGAYAVIVVGAAVLWVVGTVDDRRHVSPLARVAVEIALAAALVSAGLGWELFGSEALNFVLTVFWVVGIVNACNFFDNMDGTAATLGAVCGLGTAAMALVLDAPVLAALSLSLTGACVGFLRFNMGPPARIFMGDGGSMPLGFVVAATIMALPMEQELGASALLAGALLAGVAIFDTTLVSISRRRRGVSLMTGGRDHTTHRVAHHLGSTRRAALALGGLQALVAGVAVLTYTVSESAMIQAASVLIVVGAAGLYLLETPGWRAAYEPVHPPAGEMPVSAMADVAG